MNEQTDNQQWIEPCPEWVMWQATDWDGAVWGYARTPEKMSNERWGITAKHQHSAINLTTVPPPANWRETLVARPAKEQAVVEPEIGPAEYAEHYVASPAPASAEQPDAADREWKGSDNEWANDWYFRRLKEVGSFCHIDAIALALAARARGREQAAAELAQVRAELEKALRFGERAKCNSCLGTGEGNHSRECTTCGGRGWVMERVKDLQKQRDAALAQVEEMRRALDDAKVDTARLTAAGIGEWDIIPDHHCGGFVIQLRGRRLGSGDTIRQALDNTIAHTALQQTKLPCNKPSPES